MVGENRRILSIANQKGGVGKTTTAINLAAGLAELGAGVLLIDLDPQGNASTGLGVAANKRETSIYDVLLGDASLAAAIQKTRMEGLDICPANSDLSSTDMELVANERRSFVLRDSLMAADVLSMGYDFVLVDCPPSLNLLTLNALVASDSVLVPLQAEFFALEGLSQLMLTIRRVREVANPALRIEGIALTMYDGRNKLAQMVETDARENLGELVLKTVIPRNVKVSEAPSFSLPVLAYDAASKGAEAYRALSVEIAQRMGYVKGQRREKEHD